MEIGQLILTSAGREALANATRNGKSIKPKTFRVSSHNVNLDNIETTPDQINWWISKDISGYQMVDDDTVEFLTIVEPDEAKDYMLTIGLFLEDGTMFALGKQAYGGLIPRVRQIGRPRLRYANAAKGLLDFKYLPFSETEQSLASLDTAITLGLESIENAERMGMYEPKIKQLLKENNALKNEVYGLKGKGQQLARELEEQMLINLSANATLGLAIIKNAESIGLKK